MFNFHTNKDHYFGMQKWVTTEYVIPYLADVIDLNGKLDILEVGCGEAGVLASFLEKGYNGVGIELSPHRAETARAYLKEAIDAGKASILNENIYDVDPQKNPHLRFDAIVLKDVIEHIPNQEKFIPVLKQFLKKDGVIFFGYPPWWMPFGGHQQICKSKFLSLLPWFHLLPRSMYKGVLNLFNEPKPIVDELMDIKSTGITIERLKRILKKEKYKVVKEDLWLINPIYTKKFGFKPVKQFVNIPYLRNIISTCQYIVFKAE